VPPIPPRSDGEILANQFKNPSTTLLVASAALSLASGGTLEAGLIAGIILMNSGIGFTTERKAERKLSGLSEFGPRVAWLIRDGKQLELPLYGIVPGDLLLLEPGFNVAADARLIEAHDLLVDESILTGESLPVAKSPKAKTRTGRPLSESFNMVFKGSLVVSGRGTAVVVETGSRTQAGRIQQMLGDRYHAPTHFQRKLEELNRGMVEVSVAASAILMLTGILRNQPPLQILKMAISMAVAAVPEGLPMVSTYTMSRAVSELLRAHVLVRDLQSIEILGSVETICLDKTGTLTLNRMQVDALAVPGKGSPLSASEVLATKEPSLKSLMACAVLCNDASRREDRGSGTPTESALLEFARSFGIRSRRLRRNHPRLKSHYRTEGKPYMITSHRDHKGRLLEMMKGSPFDVLAQCRAMKLAGGTHTFDPKTREAILDQNRELSEKALRVLGFAYRVVDPTKKGKGQWIWLGLIGLKDPLRPGMRQVLDDFHSAGIRTVMITGDQASTAEAIARELGFGDGPMGVVDFSELKSKKPSAADLKALATKTRVFARVAPEDKRLIIEALRKEGRIVAMVGDGINDAPALKAAHLGIAIGQSGAAVAKEVAGIVLLDDQLDRLLSSVALGRSASESLRKALRFLTSTNISEMAVVLLQAALGLPETMDAMHLMWANLVNDTIPALALALERPHKPGPRGGDEKPSSHELVTRKDAIKIASDAAVLSLAILSSLFWGHQKNRSKNENQTLTLNTMTYGQILHALSVVSSRKVDWRDLIKNHRSLLASSLGSVGAQLAVNRLPKLKRAFKISALSSSDRVLCAAFSLFGFAVIEWKKSLEAKPSYG
jgi:Ca2+-transporting ATPase